MLSSIVFSFIKNIPYTFVDERSAEVERYSQGSCVGKVVDMVETYPFIVATIPEKLQALRFFSFAAFRR